MCLGRSLGHHAEGLGQWSVLSVILISLCPLVGGALCQQVAEDTDAMHHYPVTEINDEHWSRLLSPHCHECCLFVTAGVLYLLPSLNLPLPVALAFLGLHQHCFQFLNWDRQRHKEISWLSKREGRLKMHAGAFCHYRAISGCRLTIQFHIMEMN